MNLEQLNNASPEKAKGWFELACVAPQWIQSMVSQRPYASVGSMQDTASVIWAKLDTEQYLMAFEGHPMIGDVSTLKEKFRNTAIAAGHEQSGAADTNEAVLQSLFAKNHEYLQKHGFIFIIFATGKTAEEMLRALLARLSNTTEQEIHNAATEQDKITRLRLFKNLDQE